MSIEQACTRQLACPYLGKLLGSQLIQEGACHNLQAVQAHLFEEGKLVLLQVGGAVIPGVAASQAVVVEVVVVAQV